ncbi:alpha/beta hydrolase [Streptosporangium oxazolinicum]|uniref:Alpha/beta hydrolase n=1 Tax=Streptosporangium oxazolinicum TaxID=909287 RepID=A0ABP8ASC2_9ACTN
MSLTPVESGYAPVNGLDMYYEIHGTGRSLVLLHGSLSGIGTSFGAVLPSLARSRRVVAVEMQGHGRTADVDRPLTVEGMAEDVVALLGHLGVEEADLFGYSLGTAVAMKVAARHPGLVGRLVLASAGFHNGGLHPGVLDGIETLRPEDLAGSPFHEEYLATAPHPDRWPALVEKVKRLDADFPEWTPEAVRAIAAPMLIAAGDSDIVRPEHVVEMFRLVGGGVPGDLTELPASRLAILPGTTHLTIMHRAGLLVPMVESFLDGPVPALG